VDPGEGCDDGNGQSLDGCSSNCVVDGFDEVEVNDTLAEANGPYGAGVLLRGSIKPGSDVDYFAFLVPEVADLHLETFGASGFGSCPSVDTVLTLLAPDGAVLASDDDDGLDACSRIDRTLSAAAGHVPPGTYYARVEAYAGYKPIPAYGLAITFDALCNDGVKQGLEECDQGPGCALGCDRIPLCGDGFIDAPEVCDDGNASSGDGCSAGCQYELLGESEPNGSAATASGPFSPNVLLGGSIDPAGEVDTFALLLPFTGDLELRSFDGAGPGSCAGIDTRLTLLAPDGSTVLVDHDQGGLESCAAIDPAVPSGKSARHLAPGTYFVQVRDALGGAVIPAYTLLATYAARCGDGLVSGSEECDGGPGCGPSCDRLPLCGDGFIDAPESCDDGNLTGGDGCSAACVIELTPEIEPNGDAPTATGPLVPHALIQGAIMPGDDVDYFAVILDATSDLYLETFDGDGPGSCVGLDTVLSLHGTNGLSTLAYKDGGGLGQCSRVDPASDPGARHLPAGTYFVEVQDAQNDTVIPAYRLEIRVTARCGDGKVEGFEECDGGPACTATCDRVPLCGDGLIDLPETCDDGNSMSGDGCSATCQMEVVAEVEPNDDTAAADARALAPQPVKLSGSGFVSGAITPVGDVDLYRVELAAAATLRLETFDQSATGCTIATTLRLRDAGGAELYSDDNSGISTCSSLVLHLAAGVYYASVEERDDNALISNYRLSLQVAGDGGSEIEPNDGAASATPIAGSEVVVQGEHLLGDDTDFYALTLPAGASLRAEIIEGGEAGAEACEGFDLDSYLTLYDAEGLTLGTDDDGGRGYCSSFDGVGAIPASPFAHLLPGGLYFLAVEASPSAQAPGDSAGQFAYRLVLSTR
jgi:cysteine-rich repeat protein